LGLYVAAGAQCTFKTNRADSLIQRSSLPIFVGYGLRGNLDVNIRLNSYWFADKLRIDGTFRLKNMSDNYWGVGYYDARYTEKSDSTTEYQRFWWWFNPQIKFRVWDNLYAGVNIDYSYTEASEECQGMLEDEDYLASKDLNLNSGVGLILEYDSRDMPVNAFDGIYLSAKASYFTSSLGGDSDYGVYSIDYRQYQELFREASVLTWIVRGETCSGDVPWSELPKLGTPFDLRGYFWGRYRENTMLCGIAEYRHTLKWKGELSRLGFVLWAGGGTMGRSVSDLNCFLPNYGLGLRFAVQPRMNVRVDFGLGRESSGVYFNLLEAF
jgi:outer membrane protein assembly factor BamA